MMLELHSSNSWSGQTLVNCWSRFQLGMPCTGLGSTNHPEYVPALCSHDYDFAIRCDLQRCKEPRDPSLNQTFFLISFPNILLFVYAIHFIMIHNKTWLTFCLFCNVYLTTHITIIHASNMCTTHLDICITFVQNNAVCLFVCVSFVIKQQRNDPSAGSPTDALLRLLFPLDHPVRLNFHRW